MSIMKICMVVDIRYGKNGQENSTPGGRIMASLYIKMYGVYYEIY